MGFVLFLVAFLALSVLATVIFALGASIGYRNGIDDVHRAVKEHAARPRSSIRTDALTTRRSLTAERRGWHGATGRASPGGGPRRPQTSTQVAPAHYLPVSAVAPEHDRRPPSEEDPPGSAAMSPGTPPRRNSSRVAAALFITVLFAGPTTVALAANSVPGGALWHAKRSSENVRLSLVSEPTAEVRLHLRFAARRLSELTELMIDEANPRVVSIVSADLERHVRAAAEGVHRFEETGTATAALVAESARHLNRQVAVLEDLADIRCEPGPDRSSECTDLRQTLAASASAVASLQPGAADTSSSRPASEQTGAGPATTPDGGPRTSPADVEAAGASRNRSPAWPGARPGSNEPVGPGNSSGTGSPASQPGEPQGPPAAARTPGNESTGSDAPADDTAPPPQATSAPAADPAGEPAGNTDRRRPDTPKAPAVSGPGTGTGTARPAGPPGQGGEAPASSGEKDKDGKTKTPSKATERPGAGNSPGRTGGNGGVPRGTAPSTPRGVNLGEQGVATGPAVTVPAAPHADATASPPTSEADTGAPAVPESAEESGADTSG